MGPSCQPLEWKELEDEGYSGDEWEDRKRRIRKVFLIRRMQLAKHFIQTNVEPEWMVLCLLPVLPPELRPIVYRSGDKVVTSDINRLYERYPSLIFVRSDGDGVIVATLTMTTTTITGKASSAQ